MAHDIKKLKPNPNGRYCQGYYNPGPKYIGRTPEDRTVIYRSSLELKFCHMCDMSPAVVEWSSETLGIPYELDGKKHTYYPDYLFKTNKGVIYMVEVKPYAQCKCPSKWSSNDVKQTYRKNIAKWDAAMKFCKAHQNMQFKIVTEKFFTT